MRVWQLVLASQIWQTQNYINTHVQNYHVNTGYFDALTVPETSTKESACYVDCCHSDMFY